MAKFSTFQRNTRLTIRILISILILLICSYQIYVVCNLYFRYPTTVDIRVDPSPYVHLPGITICSELSSTILVEKLIKIEPSIYEDFVGKTRTEISIMLRKRKYREKLIRSLHSQTIDQQHNLTVSTTKFFRRCHLASPLGQHLTTTHNGTKINLKDFPRWELRNYNKINCSTISPIYETISYEFKCFTLFLNRTANMEQDINYQIPKDVAVNLKYMAWIELNRDFMFNGLIYIHSPEMHHQFSSTSNIQQLDPDKHQFVSISFERVITKLLPDPYSTKCFDYRSLGYACRDDCMTKCKTEKYLNLDGWPGDVFADSNVTEKFSNTWTNPWSDSGHMEEGVSAESLAECSERCGQQDDCLSVHYDVRTVRVRERDEDDKKESHTFTIGLLPPKNFQIINQHVPKFERIEFLIYVGGLISLYLGISVLSLLINVISFAFLSSKYQPKICTCLFDSNNHDNDNDNQNSRTDTTIYHNLPKKVIPKT